MATGVCSETGTVVVIASPLENDEHEREHLEFLAQELLDIVAGICVLSKPVSCLAHLELIATLKEFQLKLAGIVDSTTQQLEAFQRGESTVEELRVTLKRLFDDVHERVIAADAELEASYQEAMQQMMEEELSGALEERFGVAAKGLEDLFGDLLIT